MELEIHLTDRKDRIVVACDRYETKVDEHTSWLLLYRGDREIGRYISKDVKGYHELPERGLPF